MLTHHRTTAPLSVLAAITAALAVAMTVLTASAVQATALPTVYAHRGYTGTGATENTEWAFAAAATHGADGVEMDVQFTKTNLPVIMHDATVDRVTNGHGKVSSLTQTQFCALKTTDGLHPATLWGALHAAQLSKITALVELKTNPTAAQWKNFLSKIPSGFRPKMTIQSFSSPAVWAARSHSFPMVRLLNYATTASWALRYDGEAAPYTDLTKGGVAKLHAHGVKALAWTVDDPAAWKPLADMGADSIITDANPATVKAALS